MGFVPKKAIDHEIGMLRIEKSAQKHAVPLQFKKAAAISFLVHAVSIALVLAIFFLLFNSSKVIHKKETILRVKIEMKQAVKPKNMEMPKRPETKLEKIAEERPEQNKPEAPDVRKKNLKKETPLTPDVKYANYHPAPLLSVDIPEPIVPANMEKTAVSSPLKPRLIKAGSLPESVNKVNRKNFDFKNEDYIAKRNLETRALVKAQKEKRGISYGIGGDDPFPWVDLEFASAEEYQAVLDSGGLFSLKVPGEENIYIVIAEVDPPIYFTACFETSIAGRLLESGTAKAPTSRDMLENFLSNALQIIAADLAVSEESLKREGLRVLWKDPFRNYTLNLLTEYLDSSGNDIGNERVTKISMKAVNFGDHYGFRITGIETDKRTYQP